MIDDENYQSISNEAGKILDFKKEWFKKFWEIHPIYNDFIDLKH